nr:hypothetical protein [Tanacetum cinerariifolium]
MSPITLRVSAICDLYSTTVAMPDVPGAGTPMHTLAHEGSEAHGVLSGSTLSNELKPLGKHIKLCNSSIDLLQGGSGGDGNAAITAPTRAWVEAILSVRVWVRHPDGGIGGGEECLDGAVNLARRSPADGGDSEVSGDGSGVGMARSLSTSTAGGKDVNVCSRIVILAPVVAVSVEGGVGETTDGNGCSLAGSMCLSSSGIYSGYIGSGTKSGSYGCMNIGSCSSSSYGAGGVCGSSGPGMYPRRSLVMYVCTVQIPFVRTMFENGYSLDKDF